MKSRRNFFLATVLAATLTSGVAQAQQDLRWITNQVDSGNYNLSEYERNGAYYCSSVDQKVIDTSFENGYALIVFAQAAPLFFQQRELSPQLLRKLKDIEPGQYYSVLCIHSFFRDDWQDRYDAEGTVTDKLLNVEKIPSLVSEERVKNRVKLYLRQCNKIAWSKEHTTEESAYEKNICWSCA